MLSQRGYLSSPRPLRLNLCFDTAIARSGDGLVAARHLWHFGYRPVCLYPKPTQRQLFTNLVEQCKQLDIEFLSSWPGVDGLGEREQGGGLGGVPPSLLYENGYHERSRMSHSAEYFAC